MNCIYIIYYVCYVCIYCTYLFTPYIIRFIVTATVYIIAVYNYYYYSLFHICFLYRSDAVGNCTCKVTSCRAAYHAMDEREAPEQCAMKNQCAGLTGIELESCLMKWGKCVNRDMKKQFGKV